MAVLAKLQQDVSDQKTVVQSAITLIQGFKGQLDAAIAAQDPAALDALSQSLEDNTLALASAVAANTPASPQPVASVPAPASDTAQAAS